MDAEVSPEPMSRTQFQPFVDLARQACARWDVQLPSSDGSASELAVIVREALQKAAVVAAESEVPLTYAGDTPGLVGSLPGLTLDSLRSDIADGGNFGDEWGICFRVTAGEVVFDVPLVFGIDEDSASSILAELDGREREFVSIDDIAEMTGSDSVEIRAHADSWSYMKNLAKDLSLDKWSPEPFSTEWASWFPQITDLLHAIGSPRAMTGMSVVLHFQVEEENGFDWEAVNARSVVVACGLDPVQAFALLEYVRMDPHPFYDLPDGDEKRFTLIATSAMPDAMLASCRITSSGRSAAYDRLAVAMAAKEEAKEEAAA
jgi:hypothetical protein